MTQSKKQSRATSIDNSISIYKKKGGKTGSYIRQTFSDKKTNMNYNYSLKISRHAVGRISQRGIDVNTIGAILDYGEVFCKQGLEFYAVRQKNLPEKLSAKQCKKAANIVLVFSPKTTEIVTCYHCKNPFKYLAKKTCILH